MAQLLTGPCAPSTSDSSRRCEHHCTLLKGIASSRRSALFTSKHSLFNSVATIPLRPARICRVDAAAVQDEPQVAAELLQSSSAERGEKTDWIEVGRICMPHGVRGEMKVQPFTDFPEERLSTPGMRWLKPPKSGVVRQRSLKQVKLQYGRPTVYKGNQVWLVKFQGVNTPEEAELLRNHVMCIRAEDRQELEDEDDFYLSDLIGLKVVLQRNGEEVGVVTSVYDGTGAHDVLRIRLHPMDELQGALPETALIPFVRQIVPVIDLERKVMEITPPEGLLDATNSTRIKALSHQRRQQRRAAKSRGTHVKDQNDKLLAGGTLAVGRFGDFEIVMEE